MTSLFGIRHILLLVTIALIFAYYRTPKNNVFYFAHFIILLSLIQIPFCIVERLLLFFGVNLLSRTSGDAVTGTFVSYPSLVFVQLFAFGITFIYWLRNRKVIVGNNFTLLSLFILFPLFISNARAAFIFLPILSIAIAIRNYRYFFKRVGIIVVFIVLVLSGVNFIFGYFQKKDYFRDLKRQYSFRYIVDYISRKPENIWDKGELGRWESIYFSYNLVRKNISSTLVGLGPGSTQPSQFLSRVGKIYKKYWGLAFVKNQISLVLSELGILGILAYSYLFIGLALNIRRLHGKNYEGKTLSNEIVFLWDIFFVLSVVSAFSFFYGFPFATIPSIAVYAYFIAMANNYFVTKHKE